MKLVFVFNCFAEDEPDVGFDVLEKLIINRPSLFRNWE
jgi:hypothetical protein